MLKFGLGFVTAVVVIKNLPRITSVLERQLAYLELKRDMLLHDNPDLQ